MQLNVNVSVLEEAPPTQVEFLNGSFSQAFTFASELSKCGFLCGLIEVVL